MRNYFPVVAARRATSASLICAICVICGLSSALEISNSTNTPTTNAAAIYADITNVVSTTTATCYYGTTDGGTSSASWAYSTYYADATNGPVSVTVTNLQPATWYYYRWYAADTNTNAWAATSSNLTTTARAPTNYPPPGAGVTVIAGTNGVLLSPGNFFGANGIADSNTLAALQGGITTNAGNIATNAAGILDLSNGLAQANGNITTNAQNFASHSNDTANPHGVTPSQIGALAASSNLLDVADTNAARANLGAAAQADLDQVVSQTNQVVDVNGVKYTITNSPTGTELHELVLDPVTTTGYFRAQSTPFQKFSGTVAAIDGTATVAFAHGSLVKISATNDTTLTFDNADYPTNGIARVRITLYAYTNAIAFDSATINTNGFAPTIATNSPDDPTDLYFNRVTTNLWTGRY